ncbi:MAG TPA: hypothetical protein VFZ84_22845 [Burkholderiales bacterium]
MVDVLRVHDRARTHGVPLSLGLGLGQHPDPDGTVSFFEIGAGGREIDPRGWRERHTTSSWGHKPTLGLQLRAALAVCCSRVWPATSRELPR